MDIPVDPSHLRCQLVEESPTVYELQFEDAGDFDWDYILRFERQTDGTIVIKAMSNSYHSYLWSLIDPDGNVVEPLELQVTSYDFTTADEVIPPKCFN